VRESRLIAINEGERNSTAADVSAIYLISRDESKHSALGRMLLELKSIDGAEVIPTAALFRNRPHATTLS
jgi:hypothetical protein